NFPLLISSESAVNVYEANQIICPSGLCSLTSAFPKGYNAFYIMKYEISQGQYADFLNATNSLVQSVHWLNSNGSSRNTIVNTGTPPQQYSSSRPDRACNYLSWADYTAFLDWAALRPPTELEFEKACRGTNIAVTNEYAWGSTTYTDANSITVSPENGT